MKSRASSFGQSCRTILRAAGVSLVLFSSAVAAFSQGYTGIVSFGDSLTDRGNTINLTGYSDLIATVTDYDSAYYNYAGNSYSIPAEGRWSSGPTWVEYLNANLLSNQAGSAPVDLGRNSGTDHSGTNFAWAGSTSGSGYKTVGYIFNLSNLLNQVSDYKTLYGSTSFLPTASTTLYTVWSGGNDAIDWVNAGADSGTRDTIANTAATNISLALESLYDHGGRHFLVPNLPALGLKPSFITDPDKRDAANAFVTTFNSSLETALDEFESLYSDANIIKLDVFSTFQHILDNPELYGFSETDVAAFHYSSEGSTIADNPETYVFWDGTHPTTEIHQILGDIAYGQAIPEPSTIAFAMMGAGYLIVRRFRKAA